MIDSRTSAIQYAHQQGDRFLAELREFVSIPSISSDPAHDSDLVRAANWVGDRLKQLGASQVMVFETNKHPIVFAQIDGGERASAAEDCPTVLVYGHYDVQRPDPVDEWRSGPFEPVIRGDELFARGVVDNKGPMIAAIAAIESMMRSDAMPVNIKFMFEGEEEIGSPSLPGFLEANRSLLSADVSLNGDSGLAAANLPTIAYSLRGTVETRLTIKGPSIDLHSGLFGGVVHNPIHALSEIIAGMHDQDGQVAIPGFYDEVLPLNKEERGRLAAIPRGEAFTRRVSGVPALWGEEAYTPVERTGARPTLDVLKIVGGAEKTAIPASAEALVSMRLVPNQDPAEIYELLRSFIAERSPPTVSWELTSFTGSHPSYFDIDSPWIEAMSRALKSAWGVEPLYDRLGGSIPAVAMLQEQLGIDSVLIGVYRPGDNLHAPNEKLHLPTWGKMIETVIHYFYNLAA